MKRPGYICLSCATMLVILLLNSNACRSASLEFIKTDDDDDHSQLCNGTIGECVAAADGGEFIMESEVSHRFLTGGSGKRYLGYDAVNHRQAVCNAKINTNCIRQVNKKPGDCTYYNRCKGRGK